MTPSDSELLARVLVSDDRAALGDLIRRHQSAVRRFLRHLTHGDDAWADDLAQETFIEAYRGLARFGGGSRFLTWLLGIAHNRYRNARRRRREIPHETLPASAELVEDSGTSASDLRQDLAEALRRLSADERTVLHVCYRQGLSHQEAADVLSWPLGTVKTHLSRSKEKLRNLLSAWNPQS